ncbi:MAG: hypothetical protein LBB46_06020 [Coriobacteriaceae bacterium]|nr:hypothetical protein [Coriobacteriaceae bacterium]
MRIYLDNCCFNRPFDDQKQIKVKLETEAKLSIQRQISDYTEWQQSLFEGLSVRELSDLATQNYKD